MKKIIRLTESYLHRIVKESVNKVLTELDWKTYANAARKRAEQGEDDKAEHLAQFATDRFNDDFGYDELDGTYDENGLPYNQDVRGTVTPFGTVYGGMGRWTPMQSHMHAGYYPRQNKDGSHVFIHNSKMKPTKNIINKYQKASDELRKYNDGDSKYVKGKGWQ